MPVNGDSRPVFVSILRSSFLQCIPSLSSNTGARMDNIIFGPQRRTKPPARSGKRDEFRFLVPKSRWECEERLAQAALISK
ncbi:protein phosphatase 1G-like protein [Anopheles sinensis]|uniref:Protein phosphatase 1G-like protein n=1 Tax=Anopheles sinensis TaxID=74873 RepID=A0A084WGQ9_ANOSI|nr:protein phosphatase 1G-like protein [Anopheles sinensis]